MEPSGLAWICLWQIFVGVFLFKFKFIYSHLFNYNTTTIRPASEDSPLTGLTVGRGLGNRWHCGKTRGWVGRGLFVTF